MLKKYIDKRMLIHRKLAKRTLIRKAGLADAFVKGVLNGGQLTYPFFPGEMIVKNKGPPYPTAF